jgi:hypothetical protein
VQHNGHILGRVGQLDQLFREVLSSVGPHELKHAANRYPG